MHAKIIFLVVLIAITAFVLWPPPRLQENYEGQDQIQEDPGPGPNVTVVTPDQLDRVIRATQAALSNQIGKCTYCIETTNIKLVGNMYIGRYLFSVIPEPGGAPYGLSVDSTVNSDTFNVTGITLQSLKTIDTMDPFTQFTSGSEIQEGVLPTASDFQSAMQSMQGAGSGF